MNHNQPADDGIPVLTDVVDAGQAALVKAIAAQPAEALAAAHTATDAKLEKTSLRLPAAASAEYSPSE